MVYYTTNLINKGYYILMADMSVGRVVYKQSKKSDKKRWSTIPLNLINKGYYILMAKRNV